jgi:hypothetical protein
MSNLQNAAALGATQAFASVTASSTTCSTPFGTQTRYIRVQVTAGANINLRIGNTPLTAVTTDTLMNGNYPEYFLVVPGQSLAAIGTGTVSITECTQ